MMIMIIMMTTMMMITMMIMTLMKIMAAMIIAMKIMIMTTTKMINLPNKNDFHLRDPLTLKLARTNSQIVHLRSLTADGMGIDVRKHV